ncbi:bacteriorhodopsin [Candidatus Saccharibacteria bacterium]|nr:bacteriorhodopsin [Candidatus Saccharibacteria bacterium]
MENTMTLDSNTTFWLWLGFIGMTIGTIVILTFWKKFKPEHRYHVILALMVTTIAAAAYYSMANGQGVIEIGDKTVFFARYIDWILTTPFLLLSLIYVGLPAASDPEKKRQQSWLIGSVIFADIAMIATGAIANFSVTTQDKTVWFLASMAWFVVVLGLLFGQIRTQIKQDNPKNEKAYISMLSFLLVLWVIYPVLWLLGESGYSTISPTSEAAVYAVVDVTAKAVFGTVLLASLVKRKGAKVQI